MIKSLYPQFQKWAEHGTIWIISDPHFDDPESKYCNPNWPNAEDYIRSIKLFIGRHDTLICLGDVGDPKYFDKFDCYKVLITGNHDAGASKYLKKEEFVDWLDFNIAEQIIKKDKRFYIGERHNIKAAIYKKVGFFDEVYIGPLFIADRILLSHEPIFGLEEICVNIHGHTHMHPYQLAPNHINLAADVVNWGLFNLGKEIKKGLLSNTKNYHRITIDNVKK